MSVTPIAVVGPSGAGKDTLMREAAATRPDIRLVQRAITRPADQSSEDFEPVSEAEFQRLSKAGQFRLSWQAHGLSYGVPHITEPGIWLMNLSRRMLPEVAATRAALGVIHVTANPAVLAARLADRGRETQDDIAARISRPTAFDSAGLPTITVDNSGALASAKAAFLAAVQELSQ